jgi:hypothetical protein
MSKKATTLRDRAIAECPQKIANDWTAKIDPGQLKEIEELIFEFEDGGEIRKSYSHLWGLSEWIASLEFVPVSAQTINIYAKKIIKARRNGK